MPDGKFLTPVSVLHFVLHLYDQATSVLAATSMGPDAKITMVQEAVRHHDDRLAYLENRHGLLAAHSSTKFAEDAEFKDWTINRSEESWLTIIGLTRLASEGRREWQDQVRKQVIDLFRLVLNSHRANLNYSVLFVTNPLRGRNSGKPVLNVRLDSVESSRRLRDMYSGFFGRNSRVKLPQVLRGVSVRNKITKETRVRIAIMQELGNNFTSSNPGSSVKVKGYQSRPLLVTIPAQVSGAAPSDRVRTYTFIQAVKTLPPTFTDASLAAIFSIIGGQYQGELQRLFVVLSDFRILVHILRLPLIASVGHVRTLCRALLSINSAFFILVSTDEFIFRLKKFRTQILPLS